jgi:hypothetical protein
VKIRNPAFVPPAQAFINARKAEIDAWIRAQPREFVTLAELKAQFPALAAQLSDGMVHEIAKALSITVDRE